MQRSITELGHGSSAIKLSSGSLIMELGFGSSAYVSSTLGAGLGTRP